jgi:hypothetical protein
MTDALREKLRAEVMAARWADLVPQFARGALLLVAPAADLLDVAEAIARDDRAQVEALLSAGTLRRAADEDARRFTELGSQLRFQFVIVQPWVLAQEL